MTISFPRTTCIRGSFLRFMGMRSLLGGGLQRWELARVRVGGGRGVLSGELVYRGWGVIDWDMREIWGTDGV